MNFILFVLSVGYLCLNYDKVNAEATDIRNYDEYQIVSAYIQTPEDLKVIKSLEKQDDLDFWNFPKLGATAQIMTDKENAANLLSFFASKNIVSNIIIHNVEDILEEERAVNAKAKGVSSLMTWDSYQTWETMENWIKGLDALPNARVSVVGFSSERRPIYMVKVSNGPSLSHKPKKAIFIEANIHAREWISSAVATFMLQEFTSKPADYKDVFDYVDIYINPMSNPDGYFFSHLNTSTRLWRKTRSLNSDSDCFGCDPNRNFEFMWGGESTSPNPCSDTYHGTAPWSEPEVRAIRDAMKTIRNGGQEVQAYIGLHACGNVWLLSWGWTEGIYPEDFSDLLEWGTGVVAKIKEVNGTDFETGQGADIFYGVGGASDDYAKSTGIKYATTAELRCGPVSGFILPPEEIIPTGLEVLAAIRETARRIVADDPEDGGTTTTIASTSTTGSSTGILTINPSMGGSIFVILTGLLFRIIN